MHMETIFKPKKFYGTVTQDWNEWFKSCSAVNHGYN